VQPLDLLVGTVVPRVLSIAVLIAVGVALANVLVEFGVARRVARFSKYLTRPANLPDEVGTAIVTTAASTTAGYGMLAEFRDDGALDDRATLVAVTINTFFGFVQHIFTFYAPVLIPILGLQVGLMYVGSRALIALAISGVGVLAGALLLSADNVDPQVDLAAEEPEADDRSARERVRAAVESAREKVVDILPRLAVIYTVVAVLVAYYPEIAAATTDALAAAGVGVGPATALATVEGVFAWLGLPIAAVGVVAVFAVDTTSGTVTIAPMIGPTFTPRQAVATMLVGGIVSFAVSTFKRSIPFQYGIWGREFGSKVIAVNTSLKVVFIAAAVAVLLVP